MELMFGDFFDMVKYYSWGLAKGVLILTVVILFFGLIIGGIRKKRRKERRKKTSFNENKNEQKK